MNPKLNDPNWRSEVVQLPIKYFPRATRGAARPEWSEIPECAVRCPYCSKTTDVCSLTDRSEIVCEPVLLNLIIMLDAAE